MNEAARGICRYHAVHTKAVTVKYKGVRMTVGKLYMENGEKACCGRRLFYN